MPGATVSGFVLTNLDEGVKVVDVDLIARGDARSFTFLAVDPSFKATSLRVDFDKLYRSDELIHVDDEDELRTLLEAAALLRHQRRRHGERRSAEPGADR